MEAVVMWPSASTMQSIPEGLKAYHARTNRLLSLKKSVPCPAILGPDRVLKLSARAALPAAAARLHACTPLVTPVMVHT